MIQQIVITDYMSDAANQPMQTAQAVIAACPALLQGQWTVLPQAPLTACLQQLSAPSTPQAPCVAALLTQANEKPIHAAFCLIPVHLHLQRDTFSLQGTVQLPSALYQALTAMVRAHFASDFDLQTDPSERFWWVTPHRALQADSPWPQNYLYQQAFQWQPQGPEGGVLRQWSNELQMLLHQANQTSQAGEMPSTFNGLWFAKVGALPQWQHTMDVIGGQGAIFAGLQATGLTHVSQAKLDALYHQQAAHAQVMYIVDRLDQVDWQAVNVALAQKTIQKLVLILPFAERHLIVNYQPPRWWQRWRTPQTEHALLTQLQAQLT